MPERLREKELSAIVEAVRQRPEGARRSDIAVVLKGVPQRTLQSWLGSLVKDGRLTQKGTPAVQASFHRHSISSSPG